MSAVRSNPAPSNTRRSCKKPAVVWRPVWARVRVKRPVSSHTHVSAQNAAVQGNSREHTQSCHILPGAALLTNWATYCYGTEGYKWISAMTAVTGTDEGQTQGTQRHSSQYPGGDSRQGSRPQDRLGQGSYVGQEGPEAFGAQGPGCRPQEDAALPGNKCGPSGLTLTCCRTAWATSSHTKTLRTRGAQASSHALETKDAKLSFVTG